jgi:hypothetical protein
MERQLASQVSRQGEPCDNDRLLCVKGLDLSFGAACTARPLYEPGRVAWAESCVSGRTKDRRSPGTIEISKGVPRLLCSTCTCQISTQESERHCEERANKASRPLFFQSFWAATRRNRSIAQATETARKRKGCSSVCQKSIHKSG